MWLTSIWRGWRTSTRALFLRSQAHLLHALRQFEQFYNEHRPHQGIVNA